MKGQPLPPGVYRKSNGRWAKICRVCKEEHSFSDKKNVLHSEKNKRICRRCSNKIYTKRDKKFYNKIRLSWFLRTKAGALIRKIEWDLSIEYIWDLYVAQGERCALSGNKIGWSLVGVNHTASIDRIDSKVGYVRDNVQLVHKHFNMMKQAFSQKDFIQMCEMVVRYQKSLKLGQ